MQPISSSKSTMHPRRKLPNSETVCVHTFVYRMASVITGVGSGRGHSFCTIHSISPTGGSKALVTGLFPSEVIRRTSYFVTGKGGRANENCRKHNSNERQSTGMADGKQRFLGSTGRQVFSEHRRIHVWNKV